MPTRCRPVTSGGVGAFRSAVAGATLRDVQTNVLYYGDNLDIQRLGYITDESVDRIHLDPPFNSNGRNNVTVKQRVGQEYRRAAARL